MATSLLEIFLNWIILEVYLIFSAFNTFFVFYTVSCITKLTFIGLCLFVTRQSFCFISFTMWVYLEFNTEVVYGLLSEFALLALRREFVYLFLTVRICWIASKIINYALAFITFKAWSLLIVITALSIFAIFNFWFRLALCHILLWLNIILCWISVLVFTFRAYFHISYIMLITV